LPVGIHAELAIALGLTKQDHVIHEAKIDIRPFPHGAANGVGVRVVVLTQKLGWSVN
jgi:hypothetical protein